MNTPTPFLQDALAALAWQQAMGVEETVADCPMPLIAPKPDAEALLRHAHQQLEVRATDALPATAAAQAPALTESTAEAMAEAQRLAASCTSIEALRAAVEGFEGCPLKRGAKRTVFGDGNPQARVLVLGEAPGEEEDRQGVPFCGRSGQLLDRMFQAIGMARATDYFISNSVYWRPPANRAPSAEELAICRPFALQLMAIMQPKMVILMGGIAAKSMLNQDSAVSRLRASTHSIALPGGASVPARVMYHPAYLLRSPAQKAAAWNDLLALKSLLEA